jgi:hypothetical protein
MTTFLIWQVTGSQILDDLFLSLEVNVTASQAVRWGALSAELEPYTDFGSFEEETGEGGRLQAAWADNNHRYAAEHVSHRLYEQLKEVICSQISPRSPLDLPSISPRSPLDLP